MSIFIGVMTGTSIDGLDIAAIDLHPQFSLVASTEYPLPEELKTGIRDLARNLNVEWQQLGKVDALLGEFIGHCVLRFINDHKLPKSEITAIGSHGQTVHHSPDSTPAFSIQIGDASRISELTDLTVVSDFRRGDIAAGGQGAPLVPPFHQELFSSHDSIAGHDIAVCNIGGIANLTLLPGDKQHNLSGFDTGPGNTLLDAWHTRHKQGAYDRDGQWAASGSSHAKLLSALLGDPFVQRTPPKSTGVEHYNLDWLDDLLHRQTLSELLPEDIQATLSEFTARSIANALRATLPNCQRLVLCGGGRHNLDLKERLHAAANCEVVNCDALGIDGDALEAAAFAWLASRTMANLPGNAPTVTGASKPMRLGVITAPLSNP